MTREQAIQYVNTWLYRRPIDFTDIRTMREFIHLKKGKLVNLDELDKAMRNRAPIQRTRIVDAFVNSVLIHFSINELRTKNNELIRYVV